jgi:hypothetical protein
VFASGVGVLCLLAAFFVWRRLGRYPPLPPGLSALSSREAAFLSAASDAMLPAGGALAPSGSQAGIPEYVDRYLAAVPKRTRTLMRLLFLLVEQATLVFPGPGRGGRQRFSRLSTSQQVAVLEGWQRSSHFLRRLVFTSLRAILMMGYFADPAVLRAMGLAPYRIRPPVCEADLLYPPIGKGPDAIRYSRADLTPPSDGSPLRGAPIHPDYAEASSKPFGIPAAS